MAPFVARPAKTASYLFLAAAWLAAAGVALSLRKGHDIRLEWYLPAMAGLFMLVVGALLRRFAQNRVADAHLGESGQAAPSAVDHQAAAEPGRPWRWWLVLGAAIVIFRFGYFFSGQMPDGLYFEEHEAAWGARGVLRGNFGLIAQMWNRTIGALSFFIFGVSDTALRIGATTVGAVGAILFGAASWLLLERRAALFCALAFATNYSVVMASHSIEETFSIVLFVQAAMLLGIVAFVKAPAPWSGIVLGGACGIAMSEYAALKPGIVIGLAVGFGVAALRVIRTADPGLRRARGRQVLLAGAFSAATFLLLSLPMIYEITRGGDQFFEGRRAVLVGSKAEEAFDERWPGFPTSLKTHARLLFVRGLDRGLNPSGSSMLDPITVALCLLSLVLLVAYAATWAVRRMAWVVPPVLETLTRDRARPWRMGLWMTWSALAVAYCAYWNAEFVKEYRLYVVLPLLILLSGETLDAIGATFPGRAFTLVTLVLSTLLVVWNGYEHFVKRDNDRLRLAFRSKTIALCRELDARDADNRYALYWDWNGRIYLGDGPFEEWVENQTYNNYDSWACSLQHDILALPNLVDEPELLAGSARGEPLTGSQPFTHVILGTRFKNDTELLEYGDSDLLDQRLGEQIAKLAQHLDTGSCETFSDSVWFRYSICEVAIDR